jgi:hypothetical protein
MKATEELRVATTPASRKGLDVRELTSLQPRERCFLLTSPFIEPAPATAEGDERDDPNWLPDEQQKVFTDDAIARYAKRYGYTQP